MKAMKIWYAAKFQLLSPAGDHPPSKLPLVSGNQDLGGDHWAIEQAHFHFETKISITFLKKIFQGWVLSRFTNSHSGMWRLLASSLVSTPGNSLMKCGSEAQRGQTLLVSGCIWRWVTLFKSLILLCRPHLWIFSGCSANSLQASFPRRLVPWLCHLCRREPGNCHFFPSNL